MGKKRSKEQKERRREARRKAEESFAALLEEKGAEDLFEFLAFPEEYGGTQYLHEEVGYSDYESANMSEPYGLENVLYVAEYDGVYYLLEEYACGDSADFLENIPEIYQSKEEVDKRIEGIKRSNVPPLDDLIFNVKEKLPYDPSNVYIKYWGGIPGSFRVYYKHLLVIEHLYHLTAETIENAVERLASFMKENDILLEELYKLPREWNDNQRYYLISGSSGLGFFREKIHIPSRLQGRERYPIDVILQDKSGFLDRVKANEKKQVDRLRERLENQAESSENPESVLSKEEKLSLLDYLLEQHVMSACDGTLILTESWLEKMGICGDRKDAVVKEIQNGGGYCDCEVLINYLSPEDEDITD